MEPNEDKKTEESKPATPRVPPYPTDMQSKRLKCGAWINWAPGTRLTAQREEKFNELCDFLEKSYGRIRRIYINPSTKHLGKTHSINILFDFPREDAR